MKGVPLRAPPSLSPGLGKPLGWAEEVGRDRQDISDMVVSLEYSKRGRG